MKKIFFIKAIIFSVLLLGVLLILNTAIKGEIDSYHSKLIYTEKDDVDLLFLGSSRAYHSFDPYLIDDKLKLNSYVIGTPAQAMGETYYVLKEFIKNNTTPKYVVLEAFSLRTIISKDVTLHRVLDGMHPFSLTKIEAIKFYADSIVPKRNKLKLYMRYLFPFYIYHNKLLQKKIKKEPDVYWNSLLSHKGHTPSKQQKLKNKNIVFDYSIAQEEEKTYLYKKTWGFLKRFIQLCNDNNIQLIVVATPYINSKVEEKFSNPRDLSKTLNSLEYYFKKNNVKVLDLNKNYKELSIKKEDFLDFVHVNWQGAEKVSRIFSEWVIDNYDIKK